MAYKCYSLIGHVILYTSLNCCKFTVSNTTGGVPWQIVVEVVYF